MSHETIVQAPSMWYLIAGNDQVKPDVTFVVDNKELFAHRHYLSLISPVFKAMFEGDTAEAKTGRVNITDFTFDEAQTAIKFIYGKSFQPGPSLEHAFAVNRFLDKYSIDNVSRYFAMNVSLTTGQLIAGNDQVKPDVTFVVENQELFAHRHYLSLISPVFKSMFDGDTAEAKTDRVTITNFTFKTAAAAINYIYGEPLGNISLEDIFDVYKFVEKYNIEAARKQLAPTFEQEINKTNFFIIAKFAWMFANHILDRCALFLALNSNLAVTKEFIELDQRLIMELLRKASDVHVQYRSLQVTIPMRMI